MATDVLGNNALSARAYAEGETSFYHFKHPTFEPQFRRGDLARQGPI